MRSRDTEGKFLNENKVIESVCLHCKSIFVDHISHKRKFCSHKCFTDSRRFCLQKTCEQCGKSFEQRRANGELYRRRFCCRSCATSFTKKGTKNPHSEETRRKMSLAQRGNKAPNWQGGKTNKNETSRRNIEYRLWRESVFRRDNYICQMCEKRGGILNADHIKPFAYFPELRFDTSNGRTLCVSCHRKTDTYGYKAYQQWLPKTSSMWKLA